VASLWTSAAGTLDDPGKHVRAKSSLNRGVRRSGWSMARCMLEYETVLRGVTFVTVLPEFRSQQCSARGFVRPGDRVNQARFGCLASGHKVNADRHAAKNMLRRAQ
jgi:putative transposase